MPLRLFIFLFTIVEVVTVVACFKLIGVMATLALCLLAMTAGIYLLRRQGLATMERFVTRLEFGQAPMDEAWDGVCIMMAAVLLIIPGLATDILALFLLIPPLRRGLKGVLVTSGAVKSHYWFNARAISNRPMAGPGSMPDTPPANANVIDATWHEVKNDQ